MKLSANASCPCGSGKKAKGCCAPVLAGHPASSPEALMRSRYTAYATGDAHHLVRTVDPSGPCHEPDTRAWLAELRRYCAAVRFTGLVVLESGSDGDEGWVRFEATLTHEGTTRSIKERSRFRRAGGQWLYVGAMG